MAKKQDKAQDKAQDKVVQVVDLFNDLQASDLKGIACLQIYKNTRDKFDQTWQTRDYKVNFDMPCKSLQFDGKFVILDGKARFNINVYHKAQDCLVVLDKASKPIYCKLIKDNQIQSFDIQAHNKQAQASKPKKVNINLNDLQDKDIAQAKSLQDLKAILGLSD